MHPIPREEIVHFLKDLRDKIILNFEALEPHHRFQRKIWQHHSGGGGEISILRGDVFEKAAVNWSGVSGDAFPMGDAKGPFFATGISLITPCDTGKSACPHGSYEYPVYRNGNKTLVW